MLNRRALLSIPTLMIATTIPSFAVAQAQRPSGRALEQRFHHLDQNGDGVLTNDELRSEQLFQRLDRDDDGRITRRETAVLASRMAANNRQVNRTPLGELPPRPPMKVERSIPYNTIDGFDPNLLSFDLYCPKQGSRHPVIVMIHGGGWQRGDKASLGVVQAKSRHFVANDFVFISINYRLSPDVKHPEHVGDVAAALAYIHDHVAEYGGDPDQLFLIGHSAGAHLAALVATDSRYLQANGKDLSIIDGVILLDSAAFNVPRLIDELGGSPSMEAMYQTAFGDRDAWKDASPFYHVAAEQGIPPFLIYHSGNRMAGATLSAEFADALNKAGAPALAVHAHDRNHRGMNTCIGRIGDPYTAQIMEFLQNPASVTSSPLQDRQP